MRLEEEGVADQGEQRADIRERVKAVRRPARLGAAEPLLDQRTGRGQDEIWQPEAGGQQREDLHGRVAAAVRFPGVAGRDRQQCQGTRQQDEVDDGLRARLEPARGEVRVGIAAQQQHLKKQHARRPDPGPAAKPRQDVFPNERLHLEQEECSGENRQRIGGHSGKGDTRCREIKSESSGVEYRSI